MVSIYPPGPHSNLPVQGCIPDFSTHILYFNQIQQFLIPIHAVFITWMNKWIKEYIISSFYFFFLVLFLFIQLFLFYSNISSHIYLIKPYWFFETQYKYSFLLMIIPTDTITLPLRLESSLMAIWYYYIQSLVFLYDFPFSLPHTPALDLVLTERWNYIFILVIHNT